jgi:hypothetical protein
MLGHAAATNAHTAAPPVCPPHAAHQVVNVLSSKAVVERASIDEAYLDVTEEAGRSMAQLGQGGALPVPPDVERCHLAGHVSSCHLAGHVSSCHLAGHVSSCEHAGLWWEPWPGLAWPGSAHPLSGWQCWQRAVCVTAACCVCCFLGAAMASCHGDVQAAADAYLGVSPPAAWMGTCRGTLTHTHMSHSARPSMPTSVDQLHEWCSCCDSSMPCL